METTKFHQLCSAFGHAQDSFDNYRKESHLLAVELVKQLKEYYQIPESQFSLFKIDHNGQFDLVQPELVHAISLMPDRYWHFGIGLTVCKAPETLPIEVIIIHLKFKKNSQNKFYVQYANNPEKFEIKKDNSALFITFFDFLFSEIISSYNNSLQLFIGEKTERKLGYV
ncbi:hypothetical protein [Tenacibaculum xiamenense]|uniref:hypothetical protein n=1 Tax=Tenacibaculum xiamenense TaxID=1261553 RepID=UPI0038953A7F